MKIGIIGGGIMGLSLANRLAGQQHEVKVFERDSQLGGLATYHDFGGFYWDRFYHVILPTDVPLIQFIKDIGLEDELKWQTTQTGFYVDEAFHSLNNNFDFLKFPPLSLWDKFRLGLNIIYASRIDDWKRLEKIKVEDWLIKYSGKNTYEKIWKPLLLAKLGENYKRVSAVFIWSYMKRLYSARDSSAAREQMGYVAGGYKTIIEKAIAKIESNNGKVTSNVNVSRIAGNDNGITITTDQGEEKFDKVVFTAPVNVLQQVVSDELVAVDDRGSKVEYSGVICMVLVTKKEITQYYTLNITDTTIPFTGVIGMSSIVPPSETGGYHLTYLPKYVHSEDPLMKESDEKIRESFFAGMAKMFPELKEDDIVSVHINRAVKVQPLQLLNYSETTPKVKTKNSNFYVLNTAQFVNNTLNNNAVLSSVNTFIDEHWLK